MAAKGSLEAIIEVAKKELGTIEGPKDNETKYGAWIKVNFQVLIFDSPLKHTYSITV